MTEQQKLSQRLKGIELLTRAKHKADLALDKYAAGKDEEACGELYLAWVDMEHAKALLFSLGE